MTERDICRDCLMFTDECECEPEACRTPGCDGRMDDGEGWDGYCGNCADRNDAVEGVEDGYADSCPWWGQEIKMYDQRRSGAQVCSKCGRPTAIINGERRHAPRRDGPAGTD